MNYGTGPRQSSTTVPVCLGILVLLGPTFACESPPDDSSGSIQTNQSDIINGTVANSNANGVVAIYVDGQIHCSGVRVPSVPWILTALHCVTTDGGPNFFANTGAGPLIAANRFFVTNRLNPGTNSGPPSAGETVLDVRRYPDDSELDLAMLQLAHNPNWGASSGIGGPTTAQETGRNVACAGYGGNTIPFNLSTAGILRSANLHIAGSQTYPTLRIGGPRVGSLYTLTSISNQQSPDFGDSGGPCFDTFQCSSGGCGGAFAMAINMAIDTTQTPRVSYGVSLGSDNPWMPWISRTSNQTCDPCKTGGVGQSSCDAQCGPLICANDPYCCNTAWDSICVGEVTSICGLTCAH